MSYGNREQRTACSRLWGVVVAIQRLYEATLSHSLRSRRQGEIGHLAEPETANNAGESGFVPEAKRQGFDFDLGFWLCFTLLIKKQIAKPDIKLFYYNNLSLRHLFFANRFCRFAFRGRRSLCKGKNERRPGKSDKRSYYAKPCKKWDGTCENEDFCGRKWDEVCKTVQETAQKWDNDIFSISCWFNWKIDKKNPLVKVKLSRSHK